MRRTSGLRTAAAVLVAVLVLAATAWAVDGLRKDRQLSSRASVTRGEVVREVPRLLGDRLVVRLDELGGREVTVTAAVDREVGQVVDVEVDPDDLDTARVAGTRTDSRRGQVVLAVEAVLLAGSALAVAGRRGGPAAGGSATGVGDQQG